MTSPDLSTRLEPAAYVAHLRTDLAALLAASRDLAAEVPGCPGWTVRDLLGHVLGVYRHKLAALRGDVDTDGPGTPADGWGAVGPGEDVAALLAATGEELAAELGSRDAGAAAWTWWPPEQTVGFWQRRMAHETSVHRWDAQSAAHGPDGADDVDDALATDGVDELLGWLEWPWDDLPQEDARGHKVLVSTGEHSWLVALDRTAVTVVAVDEVEDADALVAGPPSDLLLHLWDRPISQGVVSHGDETALRLVRERLRMATS